VGYHSRALCEYYRTGVERITNHRAGAVCRSGRGVLAGAWPQRLLFVSTGRKDPKAIDTLYIKAIAAPLTVNTMPEGTLQAFADHGEVSGVLSADGGDGEAVLAEFDKAGADINALATKLQDDGAASTALLGRSPSIKGIDAEGMHLHV
jgi:transaldolase